MTGYRAHYTIQLARPFLVDGVMRYQAMCSCGRLTAISSRRDVEKEQKEHRKTEKRLRLM